MNTFRRYRDAIIVAVLLAVPFFILRANIRNPARLNALDRAVIRISTPFQYAAALLAHGISEVVEEYVYLVSVQKDNQRLAYENARLRARVRDLEQMGVENARLSKLLAIRKAMPADTVSARVLSKGTVGFFRVARVTLDRPSQNIRANMPVISLDGVVGQVQRVAGESVDVLLSVDSGSGIDVVSERTGARGFVRGTGDRSRYACRVEYMKRTDEVQVGDLLLTSGVGARFPKGIPVARVTKVSKRQFGIYQTVEAAPVVDLSRLDYVLIVTSLRSKPQLDTSHKRKRR